MSDYYFLNECKELKELISENPDLPLIFLQMTQIMTVSIAVCIAV